MRPDLTSLIIILVIVLIIFGPKNLPRLARVIGSWFRDFKDAKDQLPNKDDFSLDTDAPPKRAENDATSKEEPAPGKKNG